MQKNLKQFKIPRKSNSFKIHANVSLYLNTLSKVRKLGCTPKLVISFKIKNKEQIYSFMVLWIFRAFDPEAHSEQVDGDGAFCENS